MSDERKRKNEEEKLKARTLLMKKNEKIFPGNLSGAGKICWGLTELESNLGQDKRCIWL